MAFDNFFRITGFNRKMNVTEGKVSSWKVQAFPTEYTSVVVNGKGKDLMLLSVRQRGSSPSALNDGTTKK